MNEAPKCQKCGANMQPGFVTEVRPQHYMQPMSWIAGDPEETWLKNLKVETKEKHPVRAYRCPGCGCLEFYAS